MCMARKKVKTEKVKTEKTKKTKKKKERHTLSRGEFVFNFLSLVGMIAIGIYFGYRSLYYYSKQNRQNEAEAQTLNGHILQNTKVVYEEEEGLHHDTAGHYYKGNVGNRLANNLWFLLRYKLEAYFRIITISQVSESLPTYGFILSSRNNFVDHSSHFHRVGIMFTVIN